MSLHNKLEEAVCIDKVQWYSKYPEHELWSQMDQDSLSLLGSWGNYIIYKKAVSNITYFRKLCENQELIYTKPLSRVIGTEQVLKTLHSNNKNSNSNDGTEN